jgi:hypothetical protein
MNFQHAAPALHVLRRPLRHTALVHASTIVRAPSDPIAALADGAALSSECATIKQANLQQVNVF